MRRLFLATAFVALTPLAYAQMSPGTSSGMSAPMGRGTTSDTSNTYAAGPSAPSAGRMSSQPDPNNCGTPDEPKSCPPMPRRAMNSYPDNRQ
jgi:hypothetical protein